MSATGRSFRGPRGRLVTGGIEHTAPLARGSSGGPVVDAAGRLVGITTLRLGDGFAIAQPDGLDITTVRVSGRAIGTYAGELLLSRLRGEPVDQPVRDLGFSIIRRSSA